ncbi:MAG: hypothetical protein AAGC60_08960 [Acidobacteriota bacterium]
MVSPRSLVHSLPGVAPRRRLAFGVLLALIGVFALTSLGAAPASAFWCPVFPGCSFSHFQTGGGPFDLPMCCIYDCPWGLQETLICFDG